MFLSEYKDLPLRVAHSGTRDRSWINGGGIVEVDRVASEPCEMIVNAGLRQNVILKYGSQEE